MFYNYAMTVARRYAGTFENAEEVVNDSFFKVFTKIGLYSEDQPFNLWLRRIVINTAIDRFRSNIHQIQVTELQPWHDAELDAGVESKMDYEHLIGTLDHLSPAYRAVFNLYAVDGFSHEEIANMLEISVGTSKSNLSRARQHLKSLLNSDIEYSKRI
jgi:RNA polymerase sigma-70 factor (ECF subfamily)